jgi:hypothetical protein
MVADASGRDAILAVDFARQSAIQPASTTLPVNRWKNPYHH